MVENIARHGRKHETPLTRDAERIRLIRLLHVAKRDLRMEDADYRTVLQTASKGQHDSSSAMSITELERALAHMKRCGFKVRTTGKKSRPARTAPSRTLADSPDAKKVRALWLMLHELGAVKNPSEEALAAYVRRIARVDDLHWVTGEKAETLIETLKKWALRYLPDAVKKLVDEVKATRRLGYMEAMQLNDVLIRAHKRRTFEPMREAWELLKAPKTATEGIPSEQ